MIVVDGVAERQKVLVTAGGTSTVRQK
jgi:hypothetical protein